RSHADRLLTTPVVIGTRHLALPVERERPFLGGPHELHEAEELHPVVAGQRLYVRVVERRGSRGRRRHVSVSLLEPVGVSGRISNLDCASGGVSAVTRGMCEMVPLVSVAGL